MKKRFSDNTVSILLASGWHEGRAVSTSEIEMKIETEFELKILPAARKFLVEFCGIELITVRGGVLAKNDCFDAVGGAGIVGGGKGVITDFRRVNQ